MITFENSQHIDLNLHQHEILNISRPHRGMEIECEQGILWITSVGDNNDHTLAAGERFVARDSFSLLIEAVEDAVVNLKDMEERVVV